MTVKKVVVWLFLSLGLLLVGCSSDSPETAVQYLEALNQRDLETARSLVCEARQDDVTMGLTTVDDPEAEQFEFNNVSCSSRGGDVMCRYYIKQFTEAAEATGVQVERQIVFEFEDGKICGFEEQVAQ